MGVTVWRKDTKCYHRVRGKKNRFRNNSNCAHPQGDCIFLKPCLTVRRDSGQIIIMEWVLEKQDKEKTLPGAIQAMFSHQIIWELREVYTGLDHACALNIIKSFYLYFPPSLKTLFCSVTGHFPSPPITPQDQLLEAFSPLSSFLYLQQTQYFFIYST